MKISELIIALQHAKGPDRRLDTEIALLMGYERRLFIVGKGVETESKKRWFYPDKKKPVRVPWYTKTIEDAKTLTDKIVPGGASGFTWADTYSTARINDNPVVTAATPALALCVAAVSAKYIQLNPVQGGE